MHKLHFAFAYDAEDFHSVEGEVEQLLRALDYLGYDLAGGQSIASPSGSRAIQWKDPRREMAIALRFRGAAAPLLVVSAADRHDCNELFQLVADRLPVVPLDGVYDTIALPWITTHDVRAPRRLARGTGLDILAASPAADGPDVDMDE